MSGAGTAQPRHSSDTRSCCPTARQFFILLAAYFTIQVLNRCLFYGSVELDESEQLILTQSFGWSTGAQPPLYTWLQAAFFQVFGVSALALALLKNSLLFGSYAFTYWTARSLTQDHRAGVAAAVSLLFIPQIAWESQRDLTHSVLATTLAALTVFGMVQLFRTGRDRYRWLLAGCVGLGLLSKYNYALFLLGLVGAALSIASLRRQLLQVRTLAALLIPVTAVAAVLVWPGHPPQPTASAITSELHTPTVSATAASLGRFLANFFIFAGPLAILYGLLFWKNVKSLRGFQRLIGNRHPLRAGAPPSGPPTGAAHPSQWTETLARPSDDLDEYRRWLARSVVIVLAAMAAAGPFLGLHNMKERWLQPIATLLPVVAVLFVREALDARRFNRLFASAGLVALLVVITFSAGAFSAAMGQPTRLSAPFDELAPKIERLDIPANAFLAENRWIGGNLRLHFPHKEVFVPELSVPIHTNEPIVLVWNATRAETPPAALLNVCREAGWEVTARGPSYVEAAYDFAPSRKMRLGMAPVRRITAR